MSNILKSSMSIESHHIKVSRLQRHHQSLETQSYNPSIKKKSATSIIHISVKSPSNTRPISNKVFNRKNNASISPMKIELNNFSITEDSINQSINTINSLALHQNLWEDKNLNKYSTDKQCNIDYHLEFNYRNGPTQNQHRKKETKYPNNASLRWNSSGITIAGNTNSTLLNIPYGLAFDSSNTLYIADYSNNRIQKLITGTSICTTVAGQSDGTSGNTPDKFNRPTGILFDSNDNMYITDRVNNRIQLWNKGASSGTTVAGTGGTSNISLYNPTTCVSGSTSDTMYILDTYNHRIISYPSGTVVAGGNLAGTSNTQLNYPVGFVYDSVSQSFLISNYGTNKIVRWLLGAYNWTHVAGNVNGNAGSDSSSFNQPIGITMDPMGNIYVADATNHRIQFFLAGESNGTTIAGITSVSGNNSTLLYSPYWVILDNQLNLYVSDTFNHRVQKFLRY